MIPSSSKGCHQKQLTLVFSRIIMALIGAFFVSASQAQTPLPVVTGVVAGDTRGGFEVSALGAATYSIPLRLPPGTAGVVPQLAISYSANSGAGYIGDGFALTGLSTISRCPTTLAQEGFRDPVDFDQFDKFCIDGQRLIATQGAYGADQSIYRTTEESFADVRAIGQFGSFGPASFRSRTKSGLTIEFGATNDARVVGPGPAEIASWLVSKVSDRVGNYYSVTYSRNDTLGETYPIQIDFTGHSGQGVLPNNSVVFEYEDQTYPISRYMAGKKFSITKRLKKIRVQVAGVDVWDYRFSYTAEPVKLKTLLTSIQECGANGVCLPATTFGWGAAPATVTYTAMATIPNLTVANGYYSNTEKPVFVGDWNGDGRTDIGRSFGSPHYFYVANSSGTGFNYFGSVGLNVPEGSNTPSPALAADFNGDGLTDVARIKVTGGSGGADALATSTGSGFVVSGLNTPSNWNAGGFVQGYGVVGDWDGNGLPDIAKVRSNLNGQFAFFGLQLAQVDQGMGGVPYVSSSSECSITNCPWGIGDWNGDGLTDIFRVANYGIDFYQARGDFSHTFSSFVNVDGWSAFAPNQGFQSTLTRPIFLGDWNGDGLTDFGRVTGSGVSMCMSNGRSTYGPIMEPCVSTSVLSPAQGYIDDQVHPFLTGDWNGDGVTDIGRVGPTGVTLYLVTEGVPHSPVFIPALSPAQGSTDKETFPVFSGDFNGDGFDDIGRITPAGVEVYVRGYSQTDALQLIVNPLGLRTAIEYKRLSDVSYYSRGNTAVAPSMNIVPGGLFVSRVSLSDGVAPAKVVRYSYEGYRTNPSNGSGDFSKITTTEESTGLVTKNYFDQSLQHGGTLFKTEVYSGSTLLFRNQDTLNNLSIPPYQNFSYVSATSQQTYELNGALVTSEQKTFSYDQWGNLLQSALTRSDGSTETVVNTYNNDTANWRIGQLLTARVNRTPPTAQSPAPASTQRDSVFTYEASTGLLQSETVEPNSTTLRLVKSYTHDAFGNILQTTVQGIGLAPIVSSVTYDGRGQFVTHATNALGQSDTRVTDARYGKVTQLTDSNGLSKFSQYDSFGRLTLETNPDGTLSRSLYLQAPAGSPSGTSYIIRRDVSGGTIAISYFDAFGRPFREESVGLGGDKIWVDKFYDEQGNTTHVSDPYFATQKPQWTIYEYDLKGRVTREVAPGNRQTVVAYGVLTATRTNPLGQTVTTTTDVQGRVVQVVDSAGGITEYKYDTFGNPIYVRDDDWNETTYEYDNAGNKTLITTPDAGTSTFVFNSLGRLTSETNAKGETINYTHDALGRILQRQLPEGNETWVYDTALRGVGQIASVSGLNGYSETYAYDTFGRPSSVQTTVSGSNYTISRNYDSDGRVKDTTYPGGFGVRNLYSSTGHLAKIVLASNGTAIWAGTERDARGQLTRQILGNGLTTDISYDKATGFLTSKITGQVQNISYVNNALGDVTRRRDNRIGLQEDFVYDSMNRLTQAAVVGATPVTMTYDKLGNILSRSDVGVYNYNNTDGGPHAVTSIVGPRANTYNYDNSGNRFSSNNGGIEYYSTGQVSAIDEGLRRIEFQLNPRNERVLEERYQNGNWLNSKVQLAAGAFEELTKSNGQITRTYYVSSPDGLVAEFTRSVQPNTPATGKFAPFSGRFLLTDNLGSIQTITNESGAMVELLSFTAWGERRDAYTWTTATSPITSLVSRGFTGHEQLDDVKLIHMNGRVYDPLIGRFVSADPFVQDPLNTQSWNRYSYVFNNPLSYTDPTGYFSFKKFFKKIKSIVTAGIKMAIIATARAVGTIIGTCIGGPIGGAIGSHLFASFASSMLSGQSVGDSLRNAFMTLPIGLADIMLSNGVHELFKAGGSVSQFFGQFADLAQAATHGLKDAALYARSGGSFLSNFAGGFAASFGGSLAAGKSFELGLAISSGMGAIASSATGGRWEDGALRGSLIFIHNHRSESWNPMVDIADRIVWGQTEYSPPPEPFDWGLLLVPVDKIGELVAKASPFLIKFASRSFDAADRLDSQGLYFASIPPRIAGFAAGTYGLIGARPEGLKDAYKQGRFMYRYLKQSRELLYFGKP